MTKIYDGSSSLYIFILLLLNTYKDLFLTYKIDGENRARLNELKNRGKSLGENCLLGGKSVEEAIEHESFERYGSVPNTAMKEPSLGCVANIARGDKLAEIK